VFVLEPKELERLRLFVVKLGNYQHWKTGRIVAAVEKQFSVRVSKRTVQRWKKRHKLHGWDLKNESRKPKVIHYKITLFIEARVVACRRRSGYDAYRIQNILQRTSVNISMSSVKRIIEKYGLSNGSVIKGQRLKYCRWQRDTPNSLWQLDHTEETDGTIRLPVEDDCSRYCLAIVHWKRISTTKITKLLDELIERYGKPRQILTDNASLYGKEFDLWCGRRHIEHIHAGLNKPTTMGKVEKIHDIYNREIGHWKTSEKWRYQYNHMRPHRSLNGKTPGEIYNEFHRLLFFNRKTTKSIKEKNAPYVMNSHTNALFFV